MIKLKRYELQFEDALNFLTENFKDANTLSSNVTNLINFQAGKFFAVLPEDLKKKKIHEFYSGGLRNNIRDKVQLCVYINLNSDERLSCVFDDYNSVFVPEYADPLFQECGIVYKKEIYYLLNKRKASKEIIDRCFYMSNAIWHSLALLTAANFNDIKDRKLTLEKIKEICEKTELIIAGAYDGEGYVFWERQGSNYFIKPCELSRSWINRLAAKFKKNKFLDKNFEK